MPHGEHTRTVNTHYRLLKQLLASKRTIVYDDLRFLGQHTRPGGQQAIFRSQHKRLQLIERPQSSHGPGDQVS